MLTSVLQIVCRVHDLKTMATMDVKQRKCVLRITVTFIEGKGLAYMREKWEARILFMLLGDVYQESAPHHLRNGVLWGQFSFFIFLFLLPFKNISLDSVMVDLQGDSLRAETFIQDHSYLIHIGEYLIFTNGNIFIFFHYDNNMVCSLEGCNILSAIILVCHFWSFYSQCFSFMLIKMAAWFPFQIEVIISLTCCLLCDRAPTSCNQMWSESIIKY